MGTSDRIKPTQGEALQLSLNLQSRERTWTHQETYLEWQGEFDGQGNLIKIQIKAPNRQTAELLTVASTDTLIPKLYKRASFNA